MALKQVMEAYELLDSSRVNGDAVAQVFRKRGLTEVTVEHLKGEKESTDFIKVLIPGSSGKRSGGKAPTLGVIGRVGGIGARPSKVGLVSDADGAVTTVGTMLKLADMQLQGDILKGDVIGATHICPHAPIKPHHPVDFMDSPVDMNRLLQLEVDPAMDAILSVDTTKGNRVINHKGFAISPTVKEGYIFKTSEDLLDIMQIVCGRMPAVFPLTTTDITPYDNGLYHINSIMQPSVLTDAPVVGIAITTETPVPGCATGVSHVIDMEVAIRFIIEVAKAFGEEGVNFYDRDEFRRVLQRYGSMKHLQTLGKS